MKKLLTVIFCLAAALHLPAQTNLAPIRLAINNESPETAAAADLLTAEFSKNDRIQMLERADIEKVYREQGLSAGNQDYLKLGRILGADGLLLMTTNYVGTNQFLNIRLVAVKPGVVLADDTFSWPIDHLMEWSPALAAHLDLLLPKLAVAATDAVPISVVNLRSAVSSADGAETERELKLLILQRLTQEPQLFVLERQKMQLLSEEKDWNADESAFWNGAYLLEGVIDQNGYSPDTVTINARLTPAKGGAPILLDTRGSRTNLAEVINALAAKVTEALKVNSTVKEWNAADEAAQYFDEAKWALKWGVLPEARMAADSAWALGKRDMDCAIVRIRAYLVKPDTGSYQESTFTNPRNLDDVVQIAAENAAPDRVWALVLSEQNWGGAKVVRYFSVRQFPDPESIDTARRALELYQECSQTLPDQLNAGSSWYRLGIDDLTAAAQVLQHFNFVPESQPPVADKLAGLRARARAVAENLSLWPSVHDSYFVGDRVATYDELYHFEEAPSVFSVKLAYGCWWQETPEDCVALYRGLMTSPVFCYLHDHLWVRDLSSPRLVAWNKEDQKRIPTVWKNFTQELDGSTNLLWQLEAKALRLADATNEMDTARSFTNLFDAIFENRDALIANNVDQCYLAWHLGALVDAMGRDVISDLKDSLQHIYYSQYSPRLDQMDQEYRTKTAAAGQFALVFNQQKQFLKANKPFDFTEFDNTFQEEDYSPAQALEIKPLIAAYKSNLVAQLPSVRGMQKSQLMVAVDRVGFLEDDVNRTLNKPAPSPQPAVQAPSPRPAPAPPVATAPVPLPASETVTDIVTVNKFLEIPLAGLIQSSGFGTINRSQVSVTSQHWMEGKLVLNFEYMLLNYQYGAAEGSAIALLDPLTEKWDIISCPKEEIQLSSFFYHRTVLLQGELFYSDGGQIRKYDFRSGEWQVLPVSDGVNYELFSVNGHLYAANGTTIFEIIDGGKSTRILASTRRQPPASALDTETLGTPALFEGPGHSLRVCTASKIFTWTGADWREDSAAPPSVFPPTISPEEILFRTDGFNQPAAISRLMVETNTVEFLLGQKKSPNLNPAPPPVTGGSHPKRPLWPVPGDLPLTALPAAGHGTELFLLEDHSTLQDVGKFIAKDGYHAVLMCLSPGRSSPQKIYLKFDHPTGCPPVAGLGTSLGSIPWYPSPVWMRCTTNYLIFGLQKPDLSTPGGNNRVGIGYQAGIWLLPIASIENRITEQKPNR
jgi:hypothetical protein